MSSAFLAKWSEVSGPRAVRNFLVKIAICTRLGGAWALFAPAASATDSHVENRCTRLSASEYEELDARVQLLLTSEGSGRTPPAVVCDAESARMEWGERRFPIVGKASLVDEVVDIVERELHDPQRKADAHPKTAETAAVAAGQPMLQAGAGAPPPVPPVGRPAAPRALRAVDARGGGVALSVETELPSGSLPYAIGPAIDFGVAAGPIIFGGREAFRWTTSERQLVLMDFEGLIAFGAPFDPDAWLGLMLRGGAEWMIAYPAGNSNQAVVAPAMAAGLRVAHSFGAVGLWVGADLRYRLDNLTLQAREKLSAGETSASFSIGVAYVDWSRK